MPPSYTLQTPKAALPHRRSAAHCTITVHKQQKNALR